MERHQQLSLRMTSCSLATEEDSQSDCGDGKSQDQAAAITQHHNSSHCQDAFTAMNSMREKGVLCDVVLQVQGGSDPGYSAEIKAHKLVLASCSPYFQAMFTCDMSESQQTYITLREIDPTAVKLLVQFAYTAEITVSEKNVQLLLPAASLLQLHSVRQACCKFLIGQLDPTNCLGIRQFADTHGCSKLQQLSHKYALNNFVEVTQTEEFLSLPLKEILDLVSSDNLNVNIEEDVFNSIMAWIEHDLDSRQTHVAQLLGYVRLPLMSHLYLVNHVSSNRVVNTNSQCKDLLIEAMKYHLLPEQRPALQSPRTKQRRSEPLLSALFAIGGGSLFAIHGECECYDPLTDTWHVLAPMTTRRARLGVSVVGHKLYAVGGYDGCNDLYSVESYCLHSNRWKPAPQMGTRRSCLGVGQLGGLIYVVGGFDGASALNSAERFDTLTSSWTSITPCNVRRRYVRLGILDGCIFAVGGYNGNEHLSSVERYDPQTNSWSTLPPMISRRSSAGVAVLDSCLYVVGGNDGTSCLASVERFNPATNQWDPLPSMNTRRSTHDVVAMNGYLYSIGGNDGSSSLNSMERYDPKTNRWTLLSNMTTRRSSIGVTVAHISSFPPHGSEVTSTGRQ